MEQVTEPGLGELKYALRTENTDSFNKIVHHMLRSEQTSYDLLEQCFAACKEVGKGDEFTEMVRDAFASGESKAMPEIWLGEEGIQVDSFEDIRPYIELRADDFSYFLGGCMYQSGEKKNKELVQYLYKHYEDELCKCYPSWTKTLGALLDCRLNEGVEKVARRWAEIPNLLAWSFITVMIAMYRLKKFDEAGVLLMEASEELDFSTGLLASFYAMYRYLNGNNEGLAELIANTEDIEDDGFAFAARDCMLLLCEENAERVQSGVVDLFKKYKRFYTDYYWEEYRQLILKTLALLVKQHGGFGLKWQQRKFKLRCVFARIKFLQFKHEE